MKVNNASYHYEDYFWKKGYKLIAGIDEVGRGPLAGPVVCASVILDAYNKIFELRDSKKLSKKRRECLFFTIIKKAVAVSVTIIDETIIDDINIYKATLYGMTESVVNLPKKPDFLLIDAMKPDNISIPYKSIIKGDEKSASIAAASIIAKVTRDNLMYLYHKKYPVYDFKNNVGYPTKKHLIALKKYGIIPIHRKSYGPVKSIIENEKFNSE